MIGNPIGYPIGGSLTLTQTLYLTAIEQATSFGGASINLNVAATSIDQATTVSDPFVNPQINTDSIAETIAFGAPSINLTIPLIGIEHQAVIGDIVVRFIQAIVPDSIIQPFAFGTVAVTPELIFPTSIVVADAIGTTIVQHSITLTPDSDVTPGNWVNETGGSELYSHINDAIINDLDYIRSRSRYDIAHIDLSDPSQALKEPFNVSYRFRATDVTATLRVNLKQGSDTIASWLHTDIANTFVTVTQTISTPEFESITDVTDLGIEFVANVGMAIDGILGECLVGSPVVQ